MALHRRFVLPVIDRLQRHNVIVLPYGRLHYVPFAALRHPETGQYLTETFTVSLAPSASGLNHLARRTEALGGEILVLGDPKTDLPRLIGARREAESVARILGTEPLVDTRATETRVHGHAGNIGLLHLAAHGEYVPAHPIFSHIVLGADDRHDGALRLHEVWDQLDLSGTQLVALSGCQTALGRITGGDEVIGLTQAFLVAGGRAVLSTLWPVDDRASARLMVSFYQRFLAGIPAAAALRGAQIEMLKHRRYAAPYYWAGFTLTGDPEVRWKAPRAESVTQAPWKQP